MAVFAITQASGQCLYLGLSSDSKPAATAGYCFLEIDTGKVYTGDGASWNLSNNDSYAASAHVHAGNAITSGTVAAARLGSGTPDSSVYLRGDSTWNSPPGGSNAFPVGSVFIAVVSTNPATLLGYGTWSAFGAGRVLVGLDSGDTDFDTVEETGGAKTVTLDATMIPSHTHTQNSHNHTQDAHTHTQNSHTHGFTDLRGLTTGSATTNRGVTESQDTSSTATGLLTGAATAVNQNATATNQATTATNQNTGGGGAHNNVQPYIVVYMWKRTA